MYIRYRVWGTLSAAELVGGVGRRLRVVPAAEKVPEVCTLDMSHGAMGYVL